MDPHAAGHSRKQVSPAKPVLDEARPSAGSGAAGVTAEGLPREGCWDFADIYERWFDFVWRTARRLGVPEAFLDDVVQEVFVVVHRQLDGFEGRSSLKTWLFGITRRVCADHRRAARRRGSQEPLQEEGVRAPEDGPVESLARAEAVHLLYRLLETLEASKREVFVLVELEQMTVPEAAEALGVGVNTAYSRLRLARRDFERALRRQRSRAGTTRRVGSGRPSASDRSPQGGEA